MAECEKVKIGEHLWRRRFNDNDFYFTSRRVQIGGYAEEQEFDITRAIEDYLNSPQFRKKYTTWKNCESIRDTARQDGIAFGQQNPDPKKYVLREGLVKELKKKMVWGRYDCQLIMDIIRTHGLED